MDDMMNNIRMVFHPLMDLDVRYVDKESVLKRDHIKLVTYNIFIRPPPVKNNENDWKDERLVDFIKLINNYDIVCLQEMFGTLTSRRQELIKYANKSGLFFYVDVPSPSFFSKNIIDGGLLILSRFPILESEFRPFKYTVLNCAIVEKGILYAKIKVKDSYLILFNSHLQANYFNISENQWDICVKTRLTHVEEIADFIYQTIVERKLSTEDRIILVGDFNIDAHGLKHKIINLAEKFTFHDKLIDEYSFLLQKLNEKFVTFDLWKNKFEIHPFTYGITSEHSKKYDQVLTDKTDLGSTQTLDYIFEIYPTKTDYEEKNKNKKIQINYESLNIEEFLVEQKLYQQLSDHFGVSVELKYSEGGEDSMN